MKKLRWRGKSNVTSVEPKTLKKLIRIDRFSWNAQKNLEVFLKKTDISMIIDVFHSTHLIPFSGSPSTSPDASSSEVICITPPSTSSQMPPFNLRKVDSLTGPLAVSEGLEKIKRDLLRSARSSESELRPEPNQRPIYTRSELLATLSEIPKAPESSEKAPPVKKTSPRKETSPIKKPATSPKKISPLIQKPPAPPARAESPEITEIAVVTTINGTPPVKTFQQIQKEWKEDKTRDKELNQSREFENGNWEKKTLENFFFLVLCKISPKTVQFRRKNIDILPLFQTSPSTSSTRTAHTKRRNSSANCTVHTRSTYNGGSVSAMRADKNSRIIVRNNRSFCLFLLKFFQMKAGMFSAKQVRGSGKTAWEKSSKSNTDRSVRDGFSWKPLRNESKTSRMSSRDEWKPSRSMIINGLIITFYSNDNFFSCDFLLWSIVILR